MRMIGQQWNDFLLHCWHIDADDIADGQADEGLSPHVEILDVHKILSLIIDELSNSQLLTNRI